MPEALENELKRRAKSKGLGKERTGAYVYGTLDKIKKAEEGSMSSEIKRRIKSS